MHGRATILLLALAGCHLASMNGAGSDAGDDGTDGRHHHDAREPDAREPDARAADARTADAAPPPLTDAIVVVGGMQSISSPPFPEGNFEDTWLFDGATWRQVDVPAQVVPGQGGAAATVGGRAVVFGGYGLDALGFASAATLEFDGASWQSPPAVVGATGPLGRFDAAMAARGTTAVLFGGTDGRSADLPLADTWVFDGAQWTAVAPAASPPGCSACMAATLGSSVVLFGGVTATGVTNATWMFDGTTWSQVMTAHAPAPRRDAAMAEIGGKVVLFGGLGYTGEAPIAFGDTWTFDGADWTQLAPATSPPPRYLHAMARRGGVPVLFGGMNAVAIDVLITNYFNDTWTFDGATWTQVVTPSAPPVRAAHTMAEVMPR